MIAAYFSLLNKNPNENLGGLDELDSETGSIKGRKKSAGGIKKQIIQLFVLKSLRTNFSNKRREKCSRDIFETDQKELMKFENIVSDIFLTF